MYFYVGLHQPSDCVHFSRSMVSVNRLRDRKSSFRVGKWMMDSGAFTELDTYGKYRHSPEEYAKQVRRWWVNGTLEAAATQDYMCEPLILEKTGLDVLTHQRLTIERYDVIRAGCWPMVYVLPVLQGFKPHEYADHVALYGDRLAHGAWVGVGSVCKRNAKPDEIRAVLGAIKRVRPDIRLHGFGLKLTALNQSDVRQCLHSADSMAWSFSARRQGRDGNSRVEARRFVEKLS